MSVLYSPLVIGDMILQHRVIMAPMSRFRADDYGVPGDLMNQYYSQRSSVPGTLIITESTCISHAASGRHINAPGIHSQQQINGWKRVTKTVHENGSIIFLQLWAVGRAAFKETLDKQGVEMLSSSAVPIKEGDLVPRSMTGEEIESFIRNYGIAAKNAMEAGFDGVEIHAANGYLIDQFIQDTCNRRTDIWGGSIENRARFCLRVTEEVVNVIGAKKVGIRLSPNSPYQGMGMEDTMQQFSYLIQQLNTFQLAYLHLVHPRIMGVQNKDLKFAIEKWNKDSVVLLNGDFQPKEAEQTVDSMANHRKVAISFARHFASNPDLPYRLMMGFELTTSDQKSFYAAKQATGYIDYPFHGGFTGFKDTKN